MAQVGAVVNRSSGIRWRSVADGSFRFLAAGCGVLTLVFLLWIGYKLFTESSMTLHRYGAGFITDKDWDVPHERYGALPYIWGTVVSSFLALLIAVPISLGAAVFLNEIAPKWIVPPLSFLIELLAAIPSIIYGLWGFLVLCPWLQAHVYPWLEAHFGNVPIFQGPAILTNVLAASTILAIMVIPFITAVAREVLSRMPPALREGSYALGATKWETIKNIALPATRTGLIGAVILGLGRAVGETMAVVMVIGNTPNITASILKPGYSMPALLANQFNEAYSDPLQRSALFEIALILFVSTFFINGLAQLLILVTTERRGGQGENSVAERFRRAMVSAANAAKWLAIAIVVVLLALQVFKDFRSYSGAAFERPVEVLILAYLAIRGITALARGTKLWGAWRALNNFVMQGMSAFCGIAVCVVLGFLFGYIIYKGGRGINLDLFTKLPKPPNTPGGGLKNAILGTLEVVAIASIIAVPIGLFTGVFLSEYRASKLTLPIRFAADVLNGTPSVVIGLFAYAVFVLPFKHFSAFAGGAALSLIMIPIVVRVTEEVLALVPTTYREASLALGAGKAQTILRVVVPTAKSGIITGVMLAVARVAGETAPLLFTAFGTEQLNLNPTQPVSALTLKIYNYAVSPFDDWVQEAWAGALLLLIMILLINIASRFATRQKYASSHG